MAFALFCPQCDRLLLAAGECPACGWQRPRHSARPGELAGEPVPIGRPLSGAPAQFEDVIWYAAPATSPDLAGALIALHRGGSLVRRHELEALAGKRGQPVAHSLAGDGHYVFPGWTDYAFGDERPVKAVIALEPRSGRVAWQLETVSRELSTPTVEGGLLLVAGSSENRVYAVSLEEARLLWHSSVEADHRFQPAVAGETVAVLAGTLTGHRALVGLARQDGVPLWQVEMGPSAGQPLGHGRLIFVPRSQHLEAYEAADGSLRWQYGAGRVTSRGISTAPLLAAGELLLAPVGTWEDEQRGYGLHALDAATGELRWALSWPASGGRIKVAPALFGQTVVVGNSAGELFALALETGELLWQVTLPKRLVALPVQDKDMLLLPSRDGQLLRLPWRENADRPVELPAAYEAAGDWEQAAVAYALAEPPDLPGAARALLQAGQPEHALKLFQAAGDESGAAGVLAAQGRMEEALALLPEAAAEQRAAWFTELGRHDQAGELYAQLQDWEAAAGAFEAAHRPLKAVRAYHRAGRREDMLRLAAELDLEAIQALVDVLGWEAAVARFREAGQLAAAADILEGQGIWEEALALRRQEGDWVRVREICRQIGDWECEAAACLQLAEEQPRREVRVAVTIASPDGGLPERLHDRLRQAFLICEAFGSDEALGALFVDGRIAPWRRQLRDAGSDLERVEGAIALLLEQYDRAGRNALVQLALVLGERTDEQDALHGRLLALSGELEATLSRAPATRIELVESKAARQWRVLAGELYAAHERWPEAEGCFQAAGHYLRWAETLARQERWEEAGDLLSAQKIGFEQAATYYWEAAAEAVAAVPAWERRAPLAAALFEKAQDCFLFSGNLEGFLLCRTEADHCLLRPRLVLGEGELLGELQQGTTSQITLPLHNVGFGPAATVEVYAYGSALKRPREQVVWVGSAPLLAAGDEKQVDIAVEPVAAGQEEVPLQIKLLLRYRDVRSGLMAEDGPFEIHQPVLPATAQARPGVRLRIRPHHQGYYFDTREQVAIIRAARDLMHGERDVNAVLGAIPQARSGEHAGSEEPQHG